MTRSGKPSHPVRNRRAGSATKSNTSGIAAYLQERRAVLDRTLRQEDQSGVSEVLRRAIPEPAALVVIDDLTVRDRFTRQLKHADIEFHEADGTVAGLNAVAEQIHAVLFTDRIDLIRSARQLPSGAATHIVFVGNDQVAEDAWQAGANDCIPKSLSGQRFWAHITTARRIVSLAGALKLAITDNRALSTVDGLTGCGSRRFFEEQFPREVERAVRLSRPISLVMCDIDRFKQVNDRHGHLVGDEILRGVGERLSRGLRLGMDWIARFGGEEFAIVLPESTCEEGVAIAERLRVLISAHTFQTRVGALAITASFGVSGLAGTSEVPAAIAEDLIKRADDALYESKRGGRDRVTGSSGP